MSVTVTTSISGPFLHNGATTAFPFNFKAGSASEVTVYRANGADWMPVTSADFTVSVDPDAESGTVEFSVAPGMGSGFLYMVSEPSFAREGQYTGKGPFTPKGLNNQFDRAAVRDIALRRDIDRSLKLPLDDNAAVNLPAVASRAGRFLFFLPDGGGGVSSGTGSDAALQADRANPFLGSALIAGLHYKLSGDCVFYVRPGGTEHGSRE
ncbi:MAG TPA: hypothetical protein VF463_02925 [Sphingobium sp.]